MLKFIIVTKECRGLVVNGVVLLIQAVIIVIFIIIIILFMFHYIYNKPRPYRCSNMSSSNLAIHIKQSSFGIKYTQTSLCMV
jgi:hypothetical protein